MNRLLETISFILFVMFILALVLLFQGDPDLWDIIYQRLIDKVQP